ncbi:MAG: hypothetical protein N3D72_02450 [Candidatus Methanomethyliaceae archaeon]|nr:hypothetical protein [Candidatus Methanomethyliaceae archaeon]
MVLDVWIISSSAFNTGKYDPDDNACIVTCDGSKESTIDSDGGINYNVKGTAKKPTYSASQGWICESSTDSCYDENILREVYFDWFSDVIKSQSYDCRNMSCGNYTGHCTDGRCECRRTCINNAQCADGYCCENVIGVDCNGDGDTRDCIPEGICSNNKRYLCDPPFLVYVNSEESAEKKLTILDSILNFFSSINPFFRR